MTTQAQPVCPVCHDRMGVYEPILVAGEDAGTTTSLAREPRLRGETRELVHLGCAKAPA